MKHTIIIGYEPSDRFFQFQFNEVGDLVDLNFVQGLTCPHGFPIHSNESLTYHFLQNVSIDDSKTSHLDFVGKCIQGYRKELEEVDSICWDWFGLQISESFRSKAIAFGFSTPKAHELWKDYTEGCYTVDYDLYLRSLKDVVELMQETFDSAVYDSGHDCIRIERPNGYDQAIYIRWDDYKKRLVVDYHFGADEFDWNGNEDSLFRPMWDEFIYNNPITEFKTIGDYHRQLFDRICYVVDLHTSLFCYRKEMGI